MAEVVHLSVRDETIAVVAMEDRAARNTFSRDLVLGLKGAFAAIQADSRLKVVVVHGCDAVFCAGGTLEELVGIADKKLQFSDDGFYRLLLDCPVPVIAAMQGHAIGGGLVFGLYADLVVLSEESIYGATFMKYGFTPGMGATLILPEKLGLSLASEMLFTANGYHGGELRQRGVPFPVVRRAEVIPTAMRLAQDLADKPGVSLRLLKQQMTAGLLAALPRAVERELEMHDLSFAQPGIRERIQARFGR